MKYKPAMSFKCGPMAIASILNIGKAVPQNNKAVDEFASTSRGSNLAQVSEFAHKVGLKYQAAKRSAGAKVIVPAVMHWKLDHFAAITAEESGKYRLKDPTFGTDGNLLASKNVLDTESDGYFLVPEGPLPVGWSSVDTNEAARVWGKGITYSKDKDVPTKEAPKAGATGQSKICKIRKGMAVIDALTMQATTNIEDSPLGYEPPVGPDISFDVNYDYLESNQPSSFTFTNLGPDWSINWLSYLTIDGSNNVTIQVDGGGSEYYGYNTASVPYYPNIYSQATITKLGTNDWQRQLPDGTIEVFNQADGSGHLFMSEVIDPQGNSGRL